MATTTNYSWTTPDDTDLVKDGASAIRSLGTAIDTTVFTNAGASIAKATVDAKGDLIAGTADNTVDRLAVGANNTVLTADSSTATGLKWATPAAGGMTLLTTTSLSGTTTTVSAINQTYTDLIIMIRGTTYSASARVKVTFGGNDAAVTGLFDVTANNDRLQFATSNSSGSSENIGIILIKNYATASYRKAIEFYGKSHQRFIGGGAYEADTNAITSVNVTTNDGTATFSTGQVLIYGVK
jgi:hypothetical protein